MSKGILWALVQGDLSERVAPRYEQVKGHHVTLCYACELTDERRQLIGREIQAKVTANAWNDRIQALRVELPPGIECRNEHPHITLSHRDGVRSREANDMLAGEHHAEPLDLTVTLRIDFQRQGR